MKIQHNLMAMKSQRSMEILDKEKQKSMEKLTTGYRVNKSSNDAGGLVISQKMRSIVIGDDQAEQNIQDGISLVETAEGAMQEIHTMLNRIKELSTQSANGTYDTAARNEMQKEVEHVLSEIDNITERSTFGSISLLKGTVGLSLHVGPNADDFLRFTLPDTSVSALDLTRLSVSTQADASAALASVDKAIENLSTQRGTMGEFQNRLEFTKRNVTNSAINTQDAESRIRDTDIAKEMFNFTKDSIIGKSAQAMLAQSSKFSENFVALLM